jgi:outer membrane protein OmpA-like peptidoglycan-associated protein
MRLLVAFGTMLVAGTMFLAPSPADAQVWKAIKEKAVEKAAARKAKADSAIIARTSRTMDSTLEKTGRGVDGATDRIASLADSGVSKTEQAVTSLAKGRPGDLGLAADLADDGRIVIATLRFGPDDQLAGPEPVLEELARLLSAQTGAFLVEGHVATGTAADADRLRSEHRAAAVKARLVAAGVPAARLFAIGAGSAAPAIAPGAPAPPADRIEIARMQ